MTFANKSATGKRGICALFHAGRLCPALPERCRSVQSAVRCLFCAPNTRSLGYPLLSSPDASGHAGTVHTTVGSSGRTEQCAWSRRGLSLSVYSCVIRRAAQAQRLACCRSRQVTPASNPAWKLSRTSALRAVFHVESSGTPSIAVATCASVSARRDANKSVEPTAGVPSCLRFSCIGSLIVVLRRGSPWCSASPIAN
jgi:hypothetical protein